MKEFEVEIDGAIFSVKQTSSEEDTGKYGEEEAELVARACLLYEEEAEDKVYAPKRKTADETVRTEKIETVTELLRDRVTERVKEIFHDKVTEKYVESQLGNLRETETESLVPSLNYRRQIEELSRYLSRDSRRYDVYFEMY